MAFWIFMLICNLLMPLLMLGTGKFFEKCPPTHINHVFGYRTSMSMKNQEHWEFAQSYFGKLWWKMGILMLPVSIIAMLPLLGRDTGTVGLWGGVICTVQCIVLVASIFPVEVALHKKFGKNKF